MTTTEPCVSPTIAALSPDLRVNYTFGMVLGLDEFRQEQFHQQEVDALHRRLLHGYGRTYGLHTTIDADGVVTVHPGAGIDQWGREFVVRDPQCASVASWLAAQERAQPGIVQAHIDGSGELRVYVVASYATCLDNLVPLPSRSCADGEPTQAASRIRDVADIELRFTPPQTPRWDADKRLADLLARVVVGDEVGGDHRDRSDLIETVRNLLTTDPDPSLVYQVSPFEVRAVAETIFTIWAAEIRPQLQPDLITPASSWDPAVLLGGFLVIPASPFDVDNPAVRAFTATNADEGPVVQHTQLMQEIFVPPQNALVRTRSQTFVTLAPAPQNARPFTIAVWFHDLLNNTVSLPPTIEVVCEIPDSPISFATATFTTSLRRGNWILTAGNDFPGTIDRQRLLIDFRGQGVVVDGTMSLEDWAVNTGVRVVDELIAYATVPGPAATGAATAAAAAGETVTEALTEAAAAGDESATAGEVAATQAAAPARARAAEFVTISDTAAADERLGFELWFHPGRRGTQDVAVTQPKVEVFDEVTGDPLAVTGLAQDAAHPNVWTVTTDLPRHDQPFPAYLRFAFPTDGFQLAAPDADATELTAWIEASGIEFLGQDRDAASIVAYHRVAGPPAGTGADHPSGGRRGRGTRSRAAGTSDDQGRSQKR